MAALPAGLRLYRAATKAFAPAMKLLLRQRMLRGKEDARRIGERFGRTAAPRPEGVLIWVHGASVGETLAALPLLDKILAGDRHALVTSGTVTSARLLAEKLPARAIHQFAPIDSTAVVSRFFDHWRPDIGIFIDSDLWPNLILEAKKRRIPLLLANGRISERSAHNWRRAPRTIAALLSAFDVCLAQDPIFAARFQALGAPDVQISGSLKADAPPLTVDPVKMTALRDSIGNRPIFLAASTHAGEDETLLPTHDLIRRTYPDLLTIIVPRHPERAAEVAMLAGTRKLARRSEDSLPSKDTAIYVADTMGELGLFYRLAQFAFMGGSLVPHGGQNPLEPALLKCGVMAGPHTFNFTTAYDAIFEAQRKGRVTCSSEIAALALGLLGDRGAANVFGEAAATGAARLGGAVEKTAATIEMALSKNART